MTKMGVSPRFLASIGAVCVLSATLLVWTSRESKASSMTVLGAAVGSCNGAACFDCDGHKHRIDGTSSIVVYDGTDHACQSGGCGEHNCDVTNEDAGILSVAMAITALKTGSRGSPQELAMRYPKTVSINNRLHAIQIKSCKGVVVAHIPMSDPGLAANNN